MTYCYLLHPLNRFADGFPNCNMRIKHVERIENPALYRVFKAATRCVANSRGCGS